MLKRYPKLSELLHSPRATWFILGLGLLIRLIFWIIIRDQPLVGDGAEYVAEASDYSEVFIDGEPYWPPFLTLWLWIVSIFSHANLYAIRLSMIVWYLLLHFSLSTLARKTIGAAMANLTLIAIAVYPEFVVQSVEPLSYIPAAGLICLILLGMWQVIRAENPGWLIPSALAMGSLILLRPSAGLILPVLAVLWIWKGLHRIKWAVVWVMIAVSLPAGWMALLYDYEGNTFFINRANSYNFYLGNNPTTPIYETWYWGSHWNPDSTFQSIVDKSKRMDGNDADWFFRDKAISHIKAEPGLFLQRFASRARVFWAMDITAGATVQHYTGSKFLGLAASGFGALIWLSLLLAFCWTRPNYIFRGTGFPRWAFWLAVAWIIPYLLAFSHPTYHLPILPLLFILAFSRLRINPFAPENRRTLHWRIFGTLIILAIQVEWIIRVVLPKT